MRELSFPQSSTREVGNPSEKFPDRFRPSRNDILEVKILTDNNANPFHLLDFKTKATLPLRMHLDDIFTSHETDLRLAEDRNERSFSKSCPDHTAHRTAYP